MQSLSINTFAILLAVFFQGCQCKSFLLKQTNVTTPKLVRKAGYPLEEHRVTTEDGYILTLHRIPYSPRITNQTNDQPLPIAFLQHGLIASSSDWILIGPPDALGYILSDNGYDVWMGNSRGNRYSLEQLEMDSSSADFWNFSWHEMGIYDLPAVFDYISNKTEVDRFTYVGHSQGTTEFFVYCTLNPSCKDRIISAHLLAPVEFTAHFPSPVLKMLAPVFGRPDGSNKINGSFNFAPNTELHYMLSQYFCNDYSKLQFICTTNAALFDGQSNYFNESIFPLRAAVFPAGSSFKQLQHFLQGYNSGRFCQFDYGESQNLRIYGNSTPPDYHLSKVMAPTYLYYSEDDGWASPTDVFHLASLLPKAVLRRLYKIPVRKWNHIDFLYGKNVKTYLYDEVLKDINENSPYKE